MTTNLLQNGSGFFIAFPFLNQFFSHDHEKREGESRYHSLKFWLALYAPAHSSATTLFFRVTCLVWACLVWASNGSALNDFRQFDKHSNELPIGVWLNWIMNDFRWHLNAKYNDNRDKKLAILTKKKPLLNIKQILKITTFISIIHFFYEPFVQGPLGNISAIQ